MACSRCKKKEIITLPYVQQRLCPDCFAEFFERRVRKTIRNNHLLDPEDKTAVALSGGKDSMTVLTILQKLSEKAPNSELFAIVIDEGVPGYRDELMKIGKRYCEELGVPCYVFSFKKELGMTVMQMIKKAQKKHLDMQPCSYCGVFRRQLLNKKARELGADKIATGHNLDDECETALMNFLKGDVSRIARAGATVGVVRSELFVPRVKPLRETPEEEVALYAKIKKIPIVAGRCPYSQDSFRTTVNKTLTGLERRYPGMRFQILSSIDQLIPILKASPLVAKDGNASWKPRICKCGEVASGDSCKFCEMKGLLGIK